MNTKVWYLPYFEGVYHTQMIETFSNANVRMVSMIHTTYEVLRPMEESIPILVYFERNGGN